MLAREAGRQADVLMALASQYAQLRQNVMSTIGGTATSNDREMCALIREAADGAKFAAQAYAEAKRTAEAAAARAERDRAESAKRGRKTGR